MGYADRVISREEYERRSDAEDDWAPGWEAVEAPFDALYPGAEPRHLASPMAERAIFGGQEYLDGVSLYTSPRGYIHIVTFGLSSLYAAPESYGGDYSGWGYELTAKVAAPDAGDATWMASSMSALARYTFTSKRWFEPWQTVGGRDEPIRVGSDSLLTSYLIVPDTEIDGADSVHGRLDFLQLVGITSAEYLWVTEEGADPVQRGRELAERLTAAGNQELVTDLSRASLA